MFIAIDFDGTCITHEYPEIGADIGAIPVLKELVENGHKLILLTMRGAENGTLQAAISWFEQNGIELFAANANPTQVEWTDSAKVYAHIYIDDAALGIPLIYQENARPYVDWECVRGMLIMRKVLPLPIKPRFNDFPIKYFNSLGWKFLDHISNADICTDRSCFRCRCADMLFEIEDKYERNPTLF